MPRDIDASKIESENRAKYSGKTYSQDTICRVAAADSRDYFDVLLHVRMSLVQSHADHARVLDLCCATGDHLLAFAGYVTQGVGIDFSHPFLEKANHTKNANGFTNVAFVEANAREVPIRDGCFDIVYCFSSLYCIPRVGEVINEVSRLLKAGGKCVLELGNLYSLNTIVCNAYPELAHPCHIPVWEMRRLLRGADLTILEHRAFQILPLWGDRPRWLRPLLKPVWKRILQKQVRGKMLDEWISNLPVLKNFAFRHIFLCQKG
jgi:ubiquinone/menaquinone biosynthesis C-methylase UbiE